MDRIKRNVLGLVLLIIWASCVKPETEYNEKSSEGPMIIRIAELTIAHDSLEEYLDILKEESEASVRLEPGVLCIYPMYEKENPSRIRLLEIYRDQKAYEEHLNSPHFKKYKSSTQDMVESLELIDMEGIDPDSMSKIFSKIN